MKLPSFVSVARYLLTVSLVCAGSLRPLLGQQSPPESLLVQLRSPDWLIRSDALVRLGRLPQDSLPAGYADAIVQLLEQEAVSPDTTQFGEGHGEYMIQVVDAALRLRDPRTLRGMSVWGTQISRAARDFVAQQGSAALPYLDEAWNSPYASRHFVVITWALMLGKYKDRLSPSERQSVLAAVLHSDSLALIESASRIPLPEAVPLLEGMASNAGSRILRVSADQTAAALRPLREALAPAEVVQKISDVLGALCVGAQAARNDACVSLSSNLTEATTLIEANQTAAARDRLMAFAAEVDAGLQQGLWNDGERRLLGDNARYLSSRLAIALFLEGAGATANPPTLSLSTSAPTSTTAKYKDSPAITFAGGNPWAEIGTWSAPPALVSGTLAALGGAQLWLGLRNSDDIGTNFDLRVEAYENGGLVASGETHCIQGLTRNANQAHEVAVAFDAFPATAFDGTNDVLSLRVLTRIGTTETGASCGGHHNAVGLRLYFDATTRPAQLTATF